MQNKLVRFPRSPRTYNKLKDKNKLQEQKRNSLLQFPSQRIKQPATERNNNMFAGDIEYKTNFFLKFRNSFTFQRFQSQKLIRNLYNLRSIFLLSGILWLILTLLLPFVWNWSYLVWILSWLITGTHIVSYKYLTMHTNQLYLRVIVLPILLSYHYLLTNSGDLQLILALFNLPSFIINLLLSFEWTSHLLWSSLDILSIYILHIYMDLPTNSQNNYQTIPAHPSTYPLYLLLSLAVYTLIFAFIEKGLKEMWVLYDSFHRAQLIYLNLIDHSINSLFVVDKNLNILYQNKSGIQLLEASKSSDKNQDNINLNPHITPKTLFIPLNNKSMKNKDKAKKSNILSMIHPESKELLKIGIQKLGTEGKQKIQIMIKTKKESQITPVCHVSPKGRAARENEERNHLEVIEEEKGIDLDVDGRYQSPRTRNIHTQRYGLSDTIIKQGYEYFDVTIERAHWKSSNAFLLSCQNIMQNKMLLHYISRHSYKSRSLIITLTSELEDLYQKIKEGREQRKIRKSISSMTSLRNLHEQSLNIAQQNVSSLINEEQCFNLEDYLGYFLEMISIKALQKDITIIYRREGIPKKVSGDLIKFQIVFCTLLDFVIEHSFNSEVNIFVKIISIIRNKNIFLIGIDVIFDQNNELNYEDLSPIFNKKIEQGDNIMELSNKVYDEESLALLECHYLLQWLKGEMEIQKSSTNPDLLTIKFQIPFTVDVPEANIITTPKPGLLAKSKIKVNDYTIKFSPMVYKQEKVNIFENKEIAARSIHEEGKELENMVRSVRLNSRAVISPTNIESNNLLEPPIDSSIKKQHILKSSYNVRELLKQKKNEQGIFNEMQNRKAVNIKAQLGIAKRRSSELCRSRTREINNELEKVEAEAVGNMSEGEYNEIFLERLEGEELRLSTSQSVYNIEKKPKTPESSSPGHRSPLYKSSLFKDEYNSQRNKIYKEKELLSPIPIINKSILEVSLEVQESGTQTKNMGIEMGAQTEHLDNIENIDNINNQIVMQSGSGREHPTYCEKGVQTPLTLTPVYIDGSHNEYISTSSEDIDIIPNETNEQIMLRSLIPTSVDNNHTDHTDHNNHYNQSIKSKYSEYFGYPQSVMLASVGKGGSSARGFGRPIRGDRGLPMGHSLALNHPNELCMSEPIQELTATERQNIPPMITDRNLSSIQVNYSSSAQSPKKLQLTAQTSPVVTEEANEISVNFEWSSDELESEKPAQKYIFSKNPIEEKSEVDLEEFKAKRISPAKSADNFIDNFRYPNIIISEMEEESGDETNTIFKVGGLRTHSSRNLSHFGKDYYKKRKSIGVSLNIKNRFFSGERETRFINIYDQPRAKTESLDLSGEAEGQSEELKYIYNKYKRKGNTLTTPIIQEVDKAVEEMLSPVSLYQVNHILDDTAKNSEPPSANLSAQPKLPLEAILPLGITHQDDENPILKRNKQGEKTNIYQKEIRGIFTKKKWGILLRETNNTHNRLLVKRVLVVEDNHFSLNVVINLLKSLNVAHDFAKDGLQALDAYKKQAKEEIYYSVILMDLFMPLMNGYEATEKIREHEAINPLNPHTFICGLTANADLQTEEKCKACGMDVYITKPVSKSHLNELINLQYGKLSGRMGINS